MGYHLFQLPTQEELVAVVQYLWSLDIDARPQAVIETGWEDWGVTDLPAIYDVDQDSMYQGLDACMYYYEQATGMDDLLQQALQHKKAHPYYRILV